MTSTYQILSETQGAWEQSAFSETECINVAEIWRDNKDEGRGHANVPNFREIDRQAFSEWLRETSGLVQSTNTNLKGYCIFRVILVVRNNKSYVNDIDKTFFGAICAAFRHKLVQDYCGSQYAGIGSMIDEEDGEEKFFLCQHPNLAISWSQNAETRVTSAICIANDSRLDALKSMMNQKLIQDLAHFKVIPAFMSALLCSKEINIRVRDIKTHVRKVEERTGFHEWTSREDKSVTSDLVTLSAQLSGWAIRLESSTRNLGIVEEFSQFIRESLEKDLTPGSKNAMLSEIRIIQSRTSVQALDVKFIHSRVRTQKEALFDLISANDSASAQTIAAESRQIALATKSDAQSMKVLTMLATLFLPVTFVSSLFSTPMFQRQSKIDISDKSANIWTSGLGLYLAISIPLTLLTLMCWGLIIFWQGSSKQKDVEDPSNHYFQRDSGRTEKENLIKRQRAMTEEFT